MVRIVVLEVPLKSVHESSPTCITSGGRKKKEKKTHRLIRQMGECCEVDHGDGQIDSEISICICVVSCDYVDEI